MEVEVEVEAEVEVEVARPLLLDVSMQPDSLPVDVRNAQPPREEEAPKQREDSSDSMFFQE